MLLVYVVLALIVIKIFFKPKLFEEFSEFKPIKFIPRATAYLNGTNENLDTGVVERKQSSYKFELHLPEPQLIFNYRLQKNSCKCLDNCMWDSMCGCGDSKDCAAYQAYLVDPVSGNRKFVGHPRKFGDGVWRLHYTNNDNSITKTHQNVEIIYRKTVVLEGHF